MFSKIFNDVDTMCVFFFVVVESLRAYCGMLFFVYKSVSII